MGRIARAFVGVLALAIPPAARAAERPGEGAAKALHRLFEDSWEYDLREDPVRASLLGDRRWNDRWPEAGPAAVERRHAHDRDVLAALRAIDRAALAREDGVSFDLFEREYRERIEERSFKTYLVPLNQRAGIHASHELARTLRFETEKDYRDWLARLRAFSGFLDSTIALLREGIREGVLQPKVIIRRVLNQVEKQAAAGPEASPYFAPFARLPPAIPAAAQKPLAAEAREAVSSSVLPALGRFRSFLESEYLPAAPEEVGIWQWPRGEEAYAFLARKHTTTNLTIKDIHEKGLAEVKRIRAEMEAIRERTGFQGSLAEFFTHLRSDPRFYYRTPPELLAGYRTVAKRIDPLMVRVLRRLPRAPYGVEPIPEISAPDTTTAYYLEPAADGSRAGTYYVNLYQPETRPRWEVMALRLHEAVPGHHLQIALAMELDLPSFRRYGGATAFIEGWALYAESLGDDLGLYDDPYSKFGQLTYEMWRAVRLVVDTGLHAFRWSRERAIRYFLENAAKTEVDVVNEVDRYIGMPAQALAYKIGEMRIRDLRCRAEERLKSAFDARDFHQAVLQSGAVSLDLLERQIGEWLAEKR